MAMKQQLVRIVHIMNKLNNVQSGQGTISLCNNLYMNAHISVHVLDDTGSELRKMKDVSQEVILNVLPALH